MMKLLFFYEAEGWNIVFFTAAMIMVAIFIGISSIVCWECLRSCHCVPCMFCCHFRERSSISTKTLRSRSAYKTDPMTLKNKLAIETVKMEAKTINKPSVTNVAKSNLEPKMDAKVKSLPKLKLKSLEETRLPVEPLPTLKPKSTEDKVKNRDLENRQLIQEILKESLSSKSIDKLKKKSIEPVMDDDKNLKNMITKSQKRIKKSSKNGKQHKSSKEKKVNSSDMVPNRGLSLDYCPLDLTFSSLAGLKNTKEDTSTESSKSIRSKSLSKSKSVTSLSLPDDQSFSEIYRFDVRKESTPKLKTTDSISIPETKLKDTSNPKTNELLELKPALKDNKIDKNLVDKPPPNVQHGPLIRMTYNEGVYCGVSSLESNEDLKQIKDGTVLLPKMKEDIKDEKIELTFKPLSGIPLIDELGESTDLAEFNLNWPVELKEETDEITIKIPTVKVAERIDSLDSLILDQPKKPVKTNEILDSDIPKLDYNYISTEKLISLENGTIIVPKDVDISSKNRNQYLEFNNPLYKQYEPEKVYKIITDDTDLKINLKNLENDMKTIKSDPPATNNENATTLALKPKSDTKTEINSSSTKQINPNNP